MQRLPPLNAVRAFDAAARRGSLKAAAEDLAVTPGAVSRQVKLLEEHLGVALFRRRNNAVELTEAGRSFHRAVAPALESIARAAADAGRSSAEMVLAVTVSLAVRWLIPRLESFQQRHPGIEIRLTTSKNPEPAVGDEVDAVLLYRRADAADPTGGEPVLPDHSLAVCGAAALARLERSGTALRPEAWPLIGASQSDWDWHLWARMNGIDFAKLSIAHRFDSDDQAIEATLAGLGVALASKCMIERELRTGQLKPLPGTSATPLGAYWLSIAPRGRRRGVLQFRDWLREAAKEAA